MKTILVIDDEAPIINTLTAILQSSGYEVVSAESGEAGLRLAYERIPDLILCDIHLPDLDGTTVLQALREDPATADRQIVLMTGVDRESASVRNAMNLGADDFLQKPFSPNDLLHCVEARLRRNDLNRHLASRTYDQLRQTLHSTLPHEFFAPIANILGVTDLLRERDEYTRDDMLPLIADIERHARKLHRSFDNYLKLIEMETHVRPRHQAMTLGGKAWTTITSTAHATASAKDRAADLRIEGLPHPLPLSENDLATLVEELIDNACTYSRQGTPIRLCFSKDNNFIRLQVDDTGRGMTDAQVRELQEAAHPAKTPNSQEAKLHGIGLLIVQKIVETHGGGFQIKSQPSQGTTCTLFWPVQKS